MEEAMEFNEAQLTESKMVIVERDSEIGRFQNQVQTLEELLEEKIAKIKDFEVVKISLVIELREIREDKKIVDQRMLLVQQERIDERDVLIKLEQKSIQETLLLNSAFKKCQDYQRFLRLEKDKVSVYEVRFQLK
jgi:vacuolar-type H+-ATPase catalytic subunit A/Vma1